MKSQAKQARVLGCIAAALVAWFYAKALHVPAWRSGWDIGDATDIAVLTFFACRWLTWSDAS